MPCTFHCYAHWVVVYVHTYMCGFMCIYICVLCTYVHVCFQLSLPQWPGGNSSSAVPQSDLSLHTVSRTVPDHVSAHTPSLMAESTACIDASPILLYVYVGWILTVSMCHYISVRRLEGNQLTSLSDGSFSYLPALETLWVLCTLYSITRTMQRCSKLVFTP